MSTDAELVAGVLGGDRKAFAAMYDRYADRLYDFCAAVLRDRHEAQDAVQDTFVLVAQRLAQLNDPERLRPWLYAVARSVALRRAKARKRVVLDTGMDTVSDMADPGAGPHRAAEQAALRDLVWGAAAGLSERDRALLDLHLRQGLDGAELGEAMGVSAGHAYVLLTRLRDQVERSLGALLIARLGREDCPELGGLLSSWDGRFSPLMRKRVARHVDKCAACTEKRRTMVNPLALLATVPVLTAPLYLRDRVVDQVELVAHETPAPTPRPSRRPMVAAAATLLIAIGAAVTVWDRVAEVPGLPLAAEESLPGTTSVAPGPATTAATSAPPAPTTTTTRRVLPPVSTTTTTTTTTPPPPRDTTPPQITKQQATLRICTGTSNTIQATATDDVAVTAVTATWSTKSSGSGSKDLAAQPSGVWSATIGPFPREDAVTWQLTAADAAGNTTSGATATFTVYTCIR